MKTKDMEFSGNGQQFFDIKNNFMKSKDMECIR